nr:NAD(P)-binding domain-containing protein [Micropepsaceae bacterium]
MSTIAFIGLGHMGGPMAKNLLKAGHQVIAFDLAEASLNDVVQAGAKAAPSAVAAVKGVDAVVTMLPAGQHVRAVYLGATGILAAAAKGTLFIDSSTIDVDSARAVHTAAAEAGQEFVDAPVSGGTAGAAAGTLTFMSGGSDSAFARAKPILSAMGKNIVHAGGAGTGQAAKICNNMLLAISM